MNMSNSNPCPLGRPKSAMNGSPHHYTGLSTVKPTPILVRGFKLAFTIYLIFSILYTTFISFIKPAVLTVIHLSDRLNTPSVIEDQISEPSPRFEIIPRLLPGSVYFQTPGDVRIRKNIKGTSVNTAEVIAEDETSLWTTRPAASLSNSNNRQERKVMISSNGSIIPPRSTLRNFDPSLSNATISWHSPMNLLAQTYNPLEISSLPRSIRSQEILTSEDFFLSKAFGDSLGPSKVIPFYFKALGPSGNGNLDKKDISITTLVTSNRFKVFSRLVEKYQGPISATIHVSDSPKVLNPLLVDLELMYKSSPLMSTWVDIHLVVDSFDRQFNMWRNVAKFFARTDMVMMLDVDFWICTDFRKRILESDFLMQKILEGSSAFVIPAFEFTKQSDGVDVLKFPTNKHELMQVVKEGNIGMFHKSWKPGHGPTNYDYYYDLLENPVDSEVYKVRNYTHSYEPYVVYKKDGTPFCDERFIGYGANKAACLFELYLSGVSFYVLPDDFLIHQSHAYAEKTRHHERKFNRKLYSDFREEVCFRYLTQLLDQEEIKSGRNMLGECKKIKGFSAAATRLSQAYEIDLEL
ncbi:glycosyl-transferase for dystroglycan-domain-containing protein [Phakopsora pachyrhizi]|uniref:Glycosyl-transferase for dystroglycan-domain-containing protein n=1 Tax=Phakopsora pachyrhizi TaxID=170000 RepID=A0AAV0BJR8_PHAPC|nr:glycosyl-transferase for dystroglycan-domain-containing protein [Phakopsora pachyrhizi]CAH7686570.1 glycosyl-transferase for dystroglycan-domain-containing protein [Phakopsora pachyrhizi]